MTWVGLNQRPSDQKSSTRCSSGPQRPPDKALDHISQGHGFTSDLYLGRVFTSDLYLGRGFTSDLYLDHGFTSDLYLGRGFTSDLYLGCGFTSDLYLGCGFTFDLYLGRLSSLIIHATVTGWINLDPLMYRKVPKKTKISFLFLSIIEFSDISGSLRFVVYQIC